MNADDDLSRLLKKWSASEPGADFEARVLERLHAMPRSGMAFRGERLRKWFGRSVMPWESAAALAGMAAGLMLAIHTLPTDLPSTDARFRILHPASLAGSYVQMVTGGDR
jgi:hypothetical protein